jgi:cell division protein FtsA
VNKSVVRNGLISALDVGSSKVCCFIARVEGDSVRVVGIGHQVSHGVRAGVIVDMAAAEQSIRAAVHAAEQMAGETIHNVYLNFSAGSLTSQQVAVEVPLNGHPIGDNELRRLLSQGRARCSPGDREIVHTIALGYTVDGNRGIRNPRGMFGSRLGVNIHVVTSEAGPMRSLTNGVEHCHLDVAASVVSPYASALACLVDDEVDLGVTMLDMGGGTTGVAVLVEGDVVHTDVVPIGGNHITNDIARGLSTPIDHAERIKALFGSATHGHTDEREMIDVRPIGEADDAETNPVPRAELVSIIRPRVEETLELVRSRLEASGAEKAVGRRLVITGGASQLQGMREYAAQLLDKQVRIGRPLGVAGLAAATTGPAFSTCVGLLTYALNRRLEVPEQARDVEDEAVGCFGRLGQWFRENL